jgi:hypothetical protein
MRIQDMGRTVQRIRDFPDFSREFAAAPVDFGVAALGPRHG